MQKYVDRKDLVFCSYLQYFSPVWPPRRALLHSKLCQRDLEFVQRDLEFIQRDLEILQRDLEFLQRDLALQPT